MKRAAVRLLEVLLNHDGRGGSVAAAKVRLSASDQPPRLAEQAGSLLWSDGAQVVDVTYPQLGGLTSTAASVMAVIRLHRVQDARTTAVTRTVEIRLSRRSGGWAVSQLAFNGGSGIAGEAGGVAGQVLASERIQMSETSRGDIQFGKVDARILRLLLSIADRWPIGVAVVRSGHPDNVFGTDRVSNHSRNRAVDIWAVGDRPVARQDKGDPAYDLTVYALSQGATEVGGPWVVSAGGRSSYTNTVHKDHIHVGFD